MSIRRTLSADGLRDLGRLGPEVIAQVLSDARPLVRDADELHDMLLTYGALPSSEGVDWKDMFATLRAAGRATLVERTDAPPCGRLPSAGHS